jgi:hypothetical protein
VKKSTLLIICISVQYLFTIKSSAFLYISANLQKATPAKTFLIYKDLHTKMGSVEESPSGSFASFGYDFEDSQTRAELELIDDLHKLGVSKYVELPQVRYFNPSLLPIAYQFSASCCRGSEHRQKLCVTSCYRDSIFYKRQNVHSIRN